MAEPFELPVWRDEDREPQYPPPTRSYGRDSDQPDQFPQRVEDDSDAR